MLKTPSNFQNRLEKIRLINYKVYETELAKLFKRLEAARFEPILIKGWAAAQYYPQPWNRNPGDIDLVFRPEVVDRVEVDLADHNDLHGVDIHSGLRHLDTVNLEDLYRNCVWMNCAGTPVRVLRVEDHLRVLCVHWMNDGGANKEKLWDLYFAIDRFRETFDWGRCLDVVSSTRRGWIKSLIVLTCDYLGLEIENLPFAGELKKSPAWFKSAVEKEWRSEVKLNSLHLFLNNKNQLIKQILKRIPPNPLQATVEMERDIKSEMRLHFQLMNMFTRIKPSLQRMFGSKK